MKVILLISFITVLIISVAPSPNHNNVRKWLDGMDPNNGASDYYSGSEEEDTRSRRHRSQHTPPAAPRQRRNHRSRESSIPPNYEQHFVELPLPVPSGATHTRTLVQTPSGPRIALRPQIPSTRPDPRTNPFAPRSNSFPNSHQDHPAPQRAHTISTTGYAQGDPSLVSSVALLIATAKFISNEFNFCLYRVQYMKL